MFSFMHSKHNPLSPMGDHQYLSKSPYTNRIHNSILELVGHTPLVKLNRIPRDHGLSCEIYAKCEFLNPAGSSKDRIALAMLQDAEKGGHIPENVHFIEPTSGNTGIGVAFNAALRDKKCTIVMGDKNSAEKVDTMKVLGAEVIITKNSSSEEARILKDLNPDTMIMLNQFVNHINPRIHYETTGVEILNALGEVDVLVSGAGTGGTVTGCAERIRKNCPNCTIIVAEPDGSTMFNENGKKHPFLVEGIGGSTVPIVLDKSVVDNIEVVTDEESFLMAREIIQKEGLLCGGSSGTAMAAAIKYARKNNIGIGKRIVVILPDGIRNYMSKFVRDQWMEAHLFMDPPKHTMRWWKHSVSSLILANTVCTVYKEYTCAQALKTMGKINIAIVVDAHGYFVGAITKDSLRHNATNVKKYAGKNSQEINFDDAVTDHLVKDCYTLAKNSKKGMPTIGLLSRILDITPFVVIGTTVYECDGNVNGPFLVDGVATAGEVLDYIVAHQ